MSKDRQRFEAFYQAYQHKLYRLCASFCPEEADAADLFQEVLLRIWSALPGFRGEAQLSTWAYRIAVNTASGYRRSQANRPGELPLELSMPERGEEDQERLYQLRKAIAQLQPIDRLLISLQLEGMNYEEIAAISGLNTNQLGVRLHRARHRLQKILLPYGK